MSGHVITVLGQFGKTILATSVGALLADFGFDVCLIDADVQFGDVGSAFGLGPSSLMIDFVEGELGDRPLRDALPQPRAGLWVVPAPPEPSLADRVSTSFVRELLDRARNEFDVVIAHTDPFVSEPVISIVEKADYNLYVCEAMDNLKRSVVGLDSYRLLKADMARFATVGVDAAGEEWSEEHSSSLGLQVLGVIPHEPRLEGRSRRDEVGVIVDEMPESEIGLALFRIAYRVRLFVKNTPVRFTEAF